MSFTCDSYSQTIGGEYDMDVIIRGGPLTENTEYRLVWSYELIPVISHDQTDLND